MQNLAKCDYQESMTTRQTHEQTRHRTKCSQYAAMLCRQHRKYHSQFAYVNHDQSQCPTFRTSIICQAKGSKNKSPKGHWSLTWVQWALLLKVRFLSKSESMTVKFVKSTWTANNHDISIQDTRMHSVCCCCIPIWRRSPLEKGPLIVNGAKWLTLVAVHVNFCAALVSPLGGSAKKAYKHVQDHDYFTPAKFCKHPLSGSVVKADYVFPYIYMH